MLKFAELYLPRCRLLNSPTLTPDAVRLLNADFMISVGIGIPCQTPSQPSH